MSCFTARQEHAARDLLKQRIAASVSWVFNCITSLKAKITRLSWTQSLINRSAVYWCAKNVVLWKRVLLWSSVLCNELGLLSSRLLWTWSVMMWSVMTWSFMKAWSGHNICSRKNILMSMSLKQSTCSTLKNSFSVWGTDFASLRFLKRKNQRNVQSSNSFSGTVFGLRYFREISPEIFKANYQSNPPFM